MVKKKSSSNRKKNRKGAAGKANAAAVAGDHHHGYEVSAYLRYLRNKPNLTEREKRLLPMYEYAEASNMSEVVLFKDDESLRKEIKDIHSWNKADDLYFKDPRMWSFTISDMAFYYYDYENFDQVFKGPLRRQWLEQLQSRTEAMVRSAITSERIQGVLIEGKVLDIAATLLFVALRDNAIADTIAEIRRWWKVMKCLANVAKETKKISRVTGFALCQIMCMSFAHLNNNICTWVAFNTVLWSGILEQVLRNINEPWVFCDDDEDSIYNFFRFSCYPYVSMHKTVKQGSPLHNALLDILEGRIRPCKENKFVMASLYSLKRLIDLRSFKPIDLHMPNSAIEQFRHTCTKCKKEDYSKQMLVCAQCKFVSYCSKECQVKDWKDHKADCSKIQDEEYKTDKKFIKKFFTKYQQIITEKVKAVSLEASVESNELVIELDFCGSGHGIASALRDIPEFDVIPVKSFFNEGGEKLQDTYHTNDEIKRFIDSMISKLGKNFIIFRISFADRNCIGVVRFQLDSYGEIWFPR